jgi:hypothetical protein
MCLKIQYDRESTVFLKYFGTKQGLEPTAEMYSLRL